MGKPTLAARRSDAFPSIAGRHQGVSLTPSTSPSAILRFSAIRATRSGQSSEYPKFRRGIEVADEQAGFRSTFPRHSKDFRMRRSPQNYRSRCIRWRHEALPGLDFAGVPFAEILDMLHQGIPELVTVEAATFGRANRKAEQTCSSTDILAGGTAFINSFTSICLPRVS